METFSIVPRVQSSRGKLSLATAAVLRMNFSHYSLSVSLVVFPNFSGSYDSFHFG